MKSMCYLFLIPLKNTFSVLFPTVSETDCYVTLWLPTASSEKVQTKTVSNCKDPVWNEVFYFRIQSQVKNVLELTICDEDVLIDDNYRIILFDIAKVPLGESIFMKFELNSQVSVQIFSSHSDKKIYIHLCYSPPCPDVRLGFDLCPEEQEFLKKRKRVAAAAFKQVLQLEEDLQDDEVPVVAIMTTGGGIRALTAFYVHLLTIQSLDILDCISYLAGLSGTTWTMSHLYEDPYWSCKNLEETLSDVHKQVRKNKFFACFSPERLEYYAKDLWQRQQEGHSISFTDLWGLLIESMLRDGENPHKLTDQQQALAHGQNPLPIYLCLNVKEKRSNHGFREWMEFTPYEIGFQKYGAYIPAEYFGSEFFMGQLMKKIPESRICYLEGIWSSVFSLSLMDVWFLTVSSEDFWEAWTRERVTEIGKLIFCLLMQMEVTCIAYILPTRTECPPNSLANVFQDIIMWRPAVSVIPNFLKGCPMNNRYLESDFSKWKDCDLDNFPNQLTGSEDYLYLVDTAFSLDTSYPPLMRPERKVDLIIHLNYSSGSQLLPLSKASDYFLKQGIPFPKNVPRDETEKHVKECYLLGEEEGPESPLVLLFPLVCDTFREYKAPGVKRSPEEMKDGDIDLTSTLGPYNVYTLRYPEEDFEKLTKLTEYNILNNKDMLLKALHAAVGRKRQHKR
uniref:Phospholipase A2 n=1 Tax=Anolis carolinensis TaxID=28377 RepID=A0A803TM38_ANOCA